MYGLLKGKQCSRTPVSVGLLMCAKIKGRPNNLVLMPKLNDTLLISNVFAQETLIPQMINQT
jgi:hypothetical protein